MVNVEDLQQLLNDDLIAYTIMVMGDLPHAKGGWGEGFYYTSGIQKEKKMNNNRKVIGIVVQKADKILVMDHVRLNAISIPVGKCERGETFLEAAIREFKEEVNGSTDHMNMLFQWTGKREGNDVTGMVYVVDYSRLHNQLLNLEPKKHGNLRWASLTYLLGNREQLSETTRMVVDYLASKKYSAPTG